MTNTKKTADCAPSRLGLGLLLAAAFALVAIAAPARADDHGDTPATATTVRPGSVTAGVIEATGDVDWFRVSIPATTTYVMFTRGKTDTTGELFDGSLASIVARTGGGELDNFRIERELTPGIYFIKVTGAPEPTGYTLHIEGPDNGTFSDDHGMSPWSATGVAIGSTTPGVLNTRGDIDYFRFTVDTAAAYSIYTSGSTTTRGDLYDASLALLETSESGGEINNFRIDRTLAPGTYYLKLSGTSSVAGYLFHLVGPGAPAPINYTGLFWNSPAGSQPGWGVNFVHQGDTVFATWYTFGTDRAALWMVTAANKVAPNTYSGTLYTGTGPAYSAVPFDPSKVSGSAVGTATFAFSDLNNASFSYTVNGVSQVKPLTRQLFGSPRPACVWGGHTDPGLEANRQGIWWAAPSGSESGWGVNFTHQGNTIFLAWFTYAADGKPLWLVAAAELIAPDIYNGTLYSGSGPPYTATYYDPAGVVPVRMGGVTISFTGDNSADFAYIVNGVQQNKSITRQVFAAPATICQ
jgi:hypothetical protein